MANNHTTTTTHHDDAYDATIPALKRVPPREYKPRPIFWHDPEQPRNLLQSHPSSSNGLIDLLYDQNPSGTTLAGVLSYVSQWCHSQRENAAIVYLTGGHDAVSTQPPEYYREPLADGWRITSWRTGPMAVTYETFNTVTRKKLQVHVRVAAAWFDEVSSDISIIALADAYGTLQELLTMEFGQGAYLLGTPAQTGLDLLEQSLPFNLQLPVLPAELRALIQHNSPQGRNEVLTAPDGINAGIDTLNGLHCYDAKWMYAACLNHVPAGRYWHMEGMAASRAAEIFEADPHTVGFYRVLAYIPQTWQHIGLLPMWNGLQQKTVYPWEPGTTFETWATGAELQLALENGWQLDILEAIIWPDAQKLNPLRNWREKLVAIRAHAEKRGLSLVATAIRHIMIDAVGAMARRETPEHHITPHDQIKTVPHDAYNRTIQPWGIEWDKDKPLAGWAARFQHPEIAAMVWGRARTRLAKFALSFPVEYFILGRTDAWWTNGPLPPLYDVDGAGMAHRIIKPGEWREKESLSGPVAAPRDTSEALVLMRRARGKETR